MNDKVKKIAFYMKMILWSARLLGGLLFLLWGAFFLEHLEYFRNPMTPPPPYVYFVAGVHLILLMSYLLAMWKYLAGSILMIVSSLLFFVLTAGSMFLPFFIISSIPAFFYLYYWRMSGEGRRVSSKQ